MRLVLDTNIFISALLQSHSIPATLIELWLAGRFEVLTAEAQIYELARVTRYPKVRERLRPATAGRLINQLRTQATLLTDLPAVDVSPDPFDNLFLAIAQAGHADLVVTGDKRDLLVLKRHSGTAIVSAREAVERLQRGMP